MERRLSQMQSDNNERLEQMRQVVDEKLQKTLESKMTESFRLVSERLEQVYKGLGEMQSLAAGVGDLKKVLSNVKTRGILGEIQLDAILKEILSPEQYDTNVATRRGSSERVEFAVKLPADDGQYVYLPIDSKFPGDTYAALQDAYESGSPDQLRAAIAALTQQIKKEARDIHDKYIDPPNTTEFAIMFLPSEGLYAEVIRLGLVDRLQSKYRVMVTGPSTLGAFLTSLQTGFRTLAIREHSAAIEEMLAAVRAEFETFGDMLQKTQNSLAAAQNHLESVQKRSIRIQTRLADVDTFEA